MGWEAILIVYHSLREEVFTEVEIFSQPFLEDFLAMPSCGSLRGDNCMLLAHRP